MRVAGEDELVDADLGVLLDSLGDLLVASAPSKASSSRAASESSSEATSSIGCCNFSR